MKRVLYILLTFTLATSCKQKPKETATILIEPQEVTTYDSAFHQVEVFSSVEEMPQFGNGWEDVKSYFLKNINYPTSAIRDSIQGKVFVHFVIEDKGFVSSPIILRGVRDDLDNECLRAVNSMPTWKPGKLNGKPVRVGYSIAVSFILRDGHDSKGIIIKPRVLKKKDLNCKIYPNPAHDFLNIKIEDKDTPVMFQIANSNGQIVANGLLNESIEQIDISKLTNGIYYLNLTSIDNQRSKTEKFIKN